MRLLRMIEDWIREIKFAWQRVFRGYDDSAYWSLDMYIAEIALPVIKDFREDVLGVPWNDDTNDYHTKEEWEARLDKMILAFELMKKDDMCELDPKNSEQDNKTIQEGLEEFGKYFRGLWT